MKSKIRRENRLCSDNVESFYTIIQIAMYDKFIDFYEN